MKDFYKNVENNKKLLYLALIIILMGALFLRFYKLADTFSDYDDIGVLALHKIPSGQKEFTVFKNDYLNISGNVDLKKFSDKMLDTPFFAPYIGKVWTYPPGQYVFYPVVMSEKDSPDTKIWRGRAVSAFFSFMSVALLVFFLYLVNGRKLNWAVLLSVFPLAFSLNNVIYSHHMSPYSVNVTTLIISLICFHFLRNGNLKNYQFAIILGVLTYFNYLLLLTLPVFATLLIFKEKRKLIESYRSVIGKVILPIVIYLAIFLPCLLVFFKPNSAVHGNGFPWFSEGLLEALLYFPQKLLLVFTGNLAFLSTLEPLNISLTALYVLFSGYYLFRLYLKRQAPSWALLFSLGFIMEWVLLHTFGKILLEDSRHLLIWTPLLCIVLFHTINERLNQRWSCFCIVLLIIPSLWANIKNIDSKGNNFDRQIIQNHSSKMVLTYGGTLGPMLYFYGDKEVYNIEFRTFIENYKNIDFPDKILLTSTNMTFDEFKEMEEYTEVKDFLSSFKIVVLKEKYSDINYLYNNKGYCGGENNFFLYEMTKIQND